VDDQAGVLMHPRADLVYAAHADGVYRLKPRESVALENASAFVRTLNEIRTLPETTERSTT
jgi:hypothetical protein